MYTSKSSARRTRTLHARYFSSDWPPSLEGYTLDELELHMMLEKNWYG